MKTPTTRIASRAAVLTSNYLDFYFLIKSNELPPPLLQGLIPMDVTQYGRLFSTTRIPGYYL